MPEDCWRSPALENLTSSTSNEFLRLRVRKGSQFKHKSDVQKWLDLSEAAHTKRGRRAESGLAPASPIQMCGCCLTCSTRLVPTECTACYAMKNCWPRSTTSSGGIHGHRGGGRVGSIGLEHYSVRAAIGADSRPNHYAVMRKLTTGITVPQWSSILMLPIESPETYFQPLFGCSPLVYQESEWRRSQRGRNLKARMLCVRLCPTRALRQLKDYGIGLSPAS